PTRPSPKCSASWKAPGGPVRCPGAPSRPRRLKPSRRRGPARRSRLASGFGDRRQARTRGLSLINVVLWTVAAAAFAAAGFKARGLRNSTPPPGLGSACLLLATVGLALVLISNGAQRVENAVYPNSGRLLSNLCTMVAAFAALAHVMCVTCPPRKARVRIRRGLVALLVAMTAMTALFVSSRLPPVIAGFGSLYRDHPKLVGYALIYVGFSGWALMALALTAVRYAGPAARPPLRTGLWIVAVGCLVGVVYLVDKAVV